MERSISAGDANRHFSELLRHVADGESFTVMLRGRQVARLLPIDCAPQRREVERLLDFVEHLPHRRAGGCSRDDLYE